MAELLCLEKLHTSVFSGRTVGCGALWQPPLSRKTLEFVRQKEPVNPQKPEKVPPMCWPGWSGSYFGSRRQYWLVMLLISMVTFLRLIWLAARSSAFSPILLRGRTAGCTNRMKPWLSKACECFNTTLFKIIISPAFLSECLQCCLLGKLLNQLNLFQSFGWAI